jgi:CMP-N,N'-diacetyllegionaminic acid synthase
MNELYALIPARGGSKRIPGKNMKELAGNHLIYWTIQKAYLSKIFAKIIVSTDDKETKSYANFLDCEIHHRLPEHATDTSPDVEWIKDCLEKCGEPQYFMILRPTSPFRTAQGIVAAWEAFKADRYASSLKSVTRPKESPYKMVTISGNRMTALVNHPPVNGVQAFNLPSQSLPEVWYRNPCIEIGESRNVIVRGDVSGYQVMPFYMDEIEAHDINDMDDWILAEYYIKEGLVKL